MAALLIRLFPDALLFLQRISSALWLQRERSVAQRPIFAAPAETESDASRLVSARYHMQASKELLSGEDVQWIQSALRALQRAYQSHLHVLLLVCVMLGVKMMDDWPRSQKIYLDVFPQAISLREWNLLERAVLIVLDFNLWVTPEAFERKSATERSRSAIASNASTRQADDVFCSLIAVRACLCQTRRDQTNMLSEARCCHRSADIDSSCSCNEIMRDR